MISDLLITLIIIPNLEKDQALNFNLARPIIRMTHFKDFINMNPSPSSPPKAKLL